MEASKQTHREWAPGAAPGTHRSPQGEGLGVWGCQEVALTPPLPRRAIKVEVYDWDRDGR